MQGRREFMQTMAAAAVVPAANPLPRVRLGKHEITRLICGENPFYGYSHFNRLLSDLMREYCTSEMVAGILAGCERNGINTWEFTHSPRSMQDLKRHREQGGALNTIILSSREMEVDPRLIREAAKWQPIGIVHHGGVTDNRFRSGQADKIRDFIERVHDAGVLAGMSTHNPENVARAEEMGWNTDFYMTCVYRVSRTAEETRTITSELPVGETYLEGDPARMFRVIRQTKKTCLAFKILAAGRLTDSPEQIDRAFQTAFDNIKPQDGVIVGVFPKFKDQMRENADRVRRILGGGVVSE